jgi:hypothetical protein
MKFWCPEVDQKPGLDSTRSQIAKDLGDVFVDNGLDRFQFHDQSILDQKVGIVVTKNRPVLIEYRDRFLLLNFQPGFRQPMCEGILVDLFQMSAPVITVDREAGLADDVTQLVDRIPRHWTTPDLVWVLPSSSLLFCVFSCLFVAIPAFIAR